MKKRLINSPHLFIYLLLGMAVVLGLLLINPFPFHDHYLEPPQVMKDFELQTADGGLFHLSDQKGKIVLLFFGYTNCPDLCPTTLSKLKQVYSQLGDNTELVKFVMVSVDPERDTSAKIAEYVAQFNTEFIGLSGSPDELKPIWKEFGVFIERQATDGGDYFISHTASLYIIDQRENFVKLIPYEATVADVMNELVQRIP